MMRWIAPFAVLIATTIAAHWATLQYAPSVIMDRTLSTLKNRGVSLHAFTTPQRVTPQTQVVVRTSPDLFYSLCRYDLSDPASQLEVRMGEWPDYQSLSFFDAETNNFVTLRGTGKEISAILLPPGADADAGADADTNEGQAIVSPTSRGVVLIRRLAPTQELFDRASEAANADQCSFTSSEG